MVKIIKFNGGLGNQMFQYAFYLALKKRHPYFLFLFDIKDSSSCHNGFELSKLFSAIGHKRIKLYRFFYKHLSSLLYKFSIIKQPDALTYYPDIFDKKGNIIYDGFWQTEEYFKNVENEVRSHFSFNEKLLNYKTSLLSFKIKNDSESVSLHIRRGDYLREPFRLTCSLDYYSNAICLIKQKYSNPKFYIFSDDIKWVKENLKIGQAEFIDWNKGIDSWQDMYLMSLCKHNIVANSSFSWWGAWLNNNPNKCVIAPKRWFFGNNPEDIVPQNWIRL